MAENADLDKQNYDCNLKCNSDDMQLKLYAALKSSAVKSSFIPDE